jgi:hypothetical protein
VERIYVADEVAEEFTAAFKAEVEKLVQGDPMDEKVNLGPMARREAPAFLVGQFCRDARPRPRRQRKAYHSKGVNACEHCTDRRWKSEAVAETLMLTQGFSKPSAR